MISTTTIKQILPGSTIGILGGGQLGRMMALKAHEMGYRVATLDEQPGSPCGQVADREYIGSLSDPNIAREMAAQSDVLTYEFENVSDQMVAILEKTTYLPQGGRLLHTTRHRIREKMALQQLGVPIAPWRPVANRAEFEQSVEQLGYPCVIKTAVGGYDGKGQYVLRGPEDLEVAWQTVGSGSIAQGHKEWVVEGWVPFEKEISVIVARSTRGEIRSFPIAENIHRNNILHQSIVPARITSKLYEQAQAVAEKVVDGLQAIGLLAIEMFVTADGILVNELAPRPHNSGHYTMDACVTSQFEQHLRAICGLPLGDTQLLSPVVMVNILGEHVQPVMESLDQLPGNVKLHLYGKSDPQPKRKMGHLNILAASVEGALTVVDSLSIWHL